MERRSFRPSSVHSPNTNSFERPRINRKSVSASGSGSSSASKSASTVSVTTDLHFASTRRPFPRFVFGKNREKMSLVRHRRKRRRRCHRRRRRSTRWQSLCHAETKNSTEIMNN